MESNRSSKLNHYEFSLVSSFINSFIIEKRKATDIDADTVGTLDKSNDKVGEKPLTDKKKTLPPTSTYMLLIPRTIKATATAPQYNPVVQSLEGFIRKAIASFKETNSMGSLEIEAKLGIFTAATASNPQSSLSSLTRFRLPVTTPTVLVSPCSSFTRFESNMPPAYHACFNKLLNALVSEGKLLYERQKTRDVFMSDGSRKSYNSNDGQESSQLLAQVKKTRISDWNLLCPNLPFDVRVSASIETPVVDTINTVIHPSKPARIKNRMSYSNRLGKRDFAIDLTQVHSSQASREMSHELEIEFIDGKSLVESANDGQAPAVFVEKVTDFWRLISNLIASFPQQ